MIFVCTGSQKFKFTRLLKEIERLVASGFITEEVIVQTGHSDYSPAGCRCSCFFDKEEMDDLTERADLIITHGGCGSIMNALQRGKKVVAVPRLSEYHEHINDHQLQLVTELDREGYIEACIDPSHLEEAIKRAETRSFKQYTPRPGHSPLAEDIDAWLREGS